MQKDKNAVLEHPNGSGERFLARDVLQIAEELIKEAQQRSKEAKENSFVRFVRQLNERTVLKDAFRNAGFSEPHLARFVGDLKKRFAGKEDALVPRPNGDGEAINLKDFLLHAEEVLTRWQDENKADEQNHQNGPIHQAFRLTELSIDELNALVADLDERLKADPEADMPNSGPKGGEFPAKAVWPYAVRARDLALLRADPCYPAILQMQKELDYIGNNLLMYLPENGKHMGVELCKFIESTISYFDRLEEDEALHAAVQKHAAVLKREPDVYPHRLSVCEQLAKLLAEANAED